MICGLGGRVALPGSYAAARLRRHPLRAVGHHLGAPAHAGAPALLAAHPAPVPPRRRGGHLRRAREPPRGAPPRRARHRRSWPPGRGRGPLRAPVAAGGGGRRARAGRARAPGRSWLLFVGRLEQEKGDRRAAGGLARGRPGPRRPAGASPARAPARARSQGRGATVRSLGYVGASELPALYAAADALVLPRPHRNFPRALGVGRERGHAPAHPRHSQRCSRRRRGRPGGPTAAPAWCSPRATPARWPRAPSGSRRTPERARRWARPLRARCGWIPAAWAGGMRDRPCGPSGGRRKDQLLACAARSRGLRLCSGSVAHGSATYPTFRNYL